MQSIAHHEVFSCLNSQPMKHYHNQTTMYKDYTKLALLLLTPFLLLVGCEEEEQIPNDVPRIAFSVAEADLQGIETVNGEGGPAIKGTVQSDAGLKELTIELLKSSGNEVVEQLTNLDAVESKLYIIDFTPAYTPEITGVRVVAVDVQNRTAEKTMAISVEEEVPALTFSPADGPVGTEVTVNVTSYNFTEDGIASLMLGDLEISDYTVAETGTSLSFVVPEGAETGKLTVNSTAGDAIVSAASFTVTLAPKQIVEYSNIIVNAQGVRNKEGMVTNFSAEGETFTLAAGTDAGTAEKIDFIVTDSGGDNNLDLFSPSHPSWLSGNYYTDADGISVAWPVMNETKMVLLADKDATFFASVTNEELNAMSVGTDFKTRIEAGSGDGAVGSIILFQTADGKKGLVHVKAHDANADAGSKADIFTFDIKVLE